MGTEKLVKSKSRVKEHGEVFTPANIVNDMLSLDGINEYSFDLDKTVLEPACGNGNFLVQILARKLKTCREKVSDLVGYDYLLVRALSSIYAIDIQNDNVEESKERLMYLIENGSDEYGVESMYLCGAEPYSVVTGHPMNTATKELLNEVLRLNIIHGDALSECVYTDTDMPDTYPIEFVEYKFNGDTVEFGLSTLDELKRKAPSRFDGSVHKWNDVEAYRLVKNPLDDEELDF